MTTFKKLKIYRHISSSQYDILVQANHGLSYGKYVIDVAFVDKYSKTTKSVTLNYSICVGDLRHWEEVGELTSKGELEYYSL